jgi:uncharacterized protein (DUF983 family)
MDEISRINRIKNIAQLKCPNCGKAKVFYRRKFPFLKRPVMRETCESCGYRFHREPTYYRGVAYLSYGLAIIEGLIAFLLARYLIFGLSPITQVLITIGVMMFFAMWNFRLARVIWLNIFPD